MPIAGRMKVIVDTLTQADGGVKYANLQAFIAEVEARHRAGDLAATKTLVVIRDFAKMIEFAQDPVARTSLDRCPECRQFVGTNGSAMDIWVVHTPACSYGQPPRIKL